jgi:ABC-2 type transport system permease protein
MLAAARSELGRMRRPGIILGWFGLTALFAVMVNIVMFTTVSRGAALPPGAPGVSFPSVEALAGRDGIAAGLSSASSMFGLVTLSFWALSAATDYSSGLIRLLVAAQPRRWKLLAGKVGVLVAMTAAATAFAAGTCVVVAFPAAGAAGISTDVWWSSALTVVAGAWINALAAQLVWGIVGLTLAVAGRSAAVAIAFGAGYLLLVESIVKMGMNGNTDWLPGSTLAALANGGTASMSFGSALGLGIVYAAVGLGVAATIVIRRDVTD